MISPLLMVIELWSSAHCLPVDMTLWIHTVYNCTFVNSLNQPTNIVDCVKRDGHQRVCVCVAKKGEGGESRPPRPSDDFSMASLDLPTAAKAGSSKLKTADG